MDFYFFEVLHLFNFVSDGQVSTKFPNAEAYLKRVAALPGLHEYLTSDKHLEKPFNGDMASVNNMK